MTTAKRLFLFALSVLTACALALPAVAEDRTMTIIDDDGVTYVCSYVDGEHLRVVNQDTGEEVLDFDFEELEETIEDAMEEVGEALEELEDIDLDIHFGEDSYFRFESGDDRIFLDMDGIMETVADVLEELGDMEIRVNDFEWSMDDERSSRRHDHDETLEEEIARLKDEVRDLRKELRRAERRDRH